jgi:hypothetical protein
MQIQPPSPRGTGPLKERSPVTAAPRLGPLVSSSNQSSGGSQHVQKSTESSRQASDKLRELTGPEAVQVLDESLKSQSAQALQSRNAELESHLSDTGLLKDLQKTESQFKSFQKIHKQGLQDVEDLQGTARLLGGDLTASNLNSGLNSLNRFNQITLSNTKADSGLKAASQILSQKKDLNQTLELLDGNISAQNLRSATRVTQTAAKLGGSDLIAKGTGKVLAPLNAACSGKASLEACKKLWEDPNPENLKAAATQSFEFLKDLKTSLEMIPGGKTLTKAVEKLLTSVVPGLALAELSEQFLTMVTQIKRAIDKPTALNISNAVLEVVKTTASAGKLAGGIIGYASSAVYTGTELAQTLINTDWKEVATKVSDSICSMAKTASDYLSGASRWLGFA